MTRWAPRWATSWIRPCNTYVVKGRISGVLPPDIAKLNWAIPTRNGYALYCRGCANYESGVYWLPSLLIFLFPLLIKWLQILPNFTLVSIRPPKYQVVSYTTVVSFFQACLQFYTWSWYIYEIKIDIKYIHCHCLKRNRCWLPTQSRKKLRRVKVRSNGGQWKLMWRKCICIHLHSPECAIYETGAIFPVSLLLNASDLI